MRLAASFGFIIITAAILSVTTHAQGPDDSLKIYAVNILRTPKQPWPGYGIYLGKGLVITAAHVVGHASETNPRVLIAGQELPAKVIKEGDFSSIDLTLLSVDEERLPVSLRLRRNNLCQAPPATGESVIVVVPEGIAHSRIISPQRLSPDIRTRFGTVIGNVAGTGNSGSGVFDARKKCLLGIMSRKIQQVWSRKDQGNTVREVRDIAKYFVPSSVIAKFIPPEFRF
jgi:S1-C subfamily serine protease